MASNVTITFNSNPNNGDILVLRDSLRPTVDLRFEYRTTNVGSQFILIGNDAAITLFNSFSFFNINYNAIGLYNLTVAGNGNELVITSTNVSSQFTEVSNVTGGRLTTTISNDPIVSDYTISSIEVMEAASNQCSNVLLRVTTSLPTSQVTSPISQPIANLTTFDITVPRANTITVSTLSNESPQRSATSTVNVPMLLAARFTLEINVVPTGGNVTANNDFVSPAFILEYSTDNTTFYSSNSFSGIAQGNHTLYIRDNIGCSISIPYTIGAFTPNVETILPFIQVSNLNSFRFKKVEDLTTNIKTVNNTLSFEENAEENSRNYLQPFEKGDGIIKTQVKTSYNTVVAKLIDCDKNETTLTVSKESSNLDITDVRDGKVLSVSYLGTNYVGIQYGNGNTYDPITLADNGDYNLGNSLPEWVNVGDLLNIESQGWYRVIDIRLEGVIQTAILDLLVIDFNVTIPMQGLTRMITSIYNAQQYEIYEFSVDMTNLDGSYQISIDFEDTRFTNTSYLSEYISVKTKHRNTHLFQWYDTKNTEVNFNTGIRGKCRFRYIDNLRWSPNVNQEVVMTDTRTILINAVVREYYSVSLAEIPTAMAQKAALIMSQDRLFIDNYNLIKETEAELLQIQFTNLYQITQQLTRSDYVFETGNSATEILPTDSNGLFIDGDETGLLLIN